MKAMADHSTYLQDTYRGDKQSRQETNTQVPGRGALLRQLLDVLDQLHRKLHPAANGAKKNTPDPSASTPSAPAPIDPELLRQPLQQLLKASHLPAASLASLLRQGSNSGLVEPHLQHLFSTATDLLFDLSLDLSDPPPFPSTPPTETTWKLPAVTSRNPASGAPDDTPRPRDQSCASHSHTPLSSPEDLKLHPNDPRIPSPPRRPTSSLAQLRMLSDPLSASKVPLSTTPPNPLGVPHEQWSSGALTRAPSSSASEAGVDAALYGSSPFGSRDIPSLADALRLSPLHTSTHASDEALQSAFAARCSLDFDRAPGGRTAPAPTVALLKPTMVELVTENGSIGAHFRPVVRSSSPGALMLAGVVTPSGSGTGSGSSSGGGTPRFPLQQPIAPPAGASMAVQAAGAQPALRISTSGSAPGPNSSFAPPPGGFVPATPTANPPSPPTFTDITNTSPPMRAAPAAPAPAAQHAAVISIPRPKQPARLLPPTVSELLEQLRSSRPDVRKHLDKGHVTILKESGPVCAACITHFQLAKMPGNWVQHHEVSNPPAYLHGIISRIAHLLRPESAQALLQLRARRPDIAEAVDLRAFECVLEEEAASKGLLLDVLARLEQQLPAGRAEGGRPKRRTCAELAVKIKRVMREALVDRAR